jgi:hypothetical protein
MKRTIATESGAFFPQPPALVHQEPQGRAASLARSSPRLREPNQIRALRVAPLLCHQSTHPRTVELRGLPDGYAENERHLVAIEKLCRRFDNLSKNPPCHETLGPDLLPDDLVRRRLFSDPPT